MSNCSLVWSFGFGHSLGFCHFSLGFENPWFMESPEAIFSAHWDDEPVLCKSLLCSPTFFRFLGRQGRIRRRATLLDRGKPDEERCQPAGNVTDRILEGKNDRIIVQLVAGCQQPRSRNPIQE